jgi:hypothetical protein
MGHVLAPPSGIIILSALMLHFSIEKAKRKLVNFCSIVEAVILIVFFIYYFINTLHVVTYQFIRMATNNKKQEATTFQTIQ